QAVGVHLGVVARTGHTERERVEHLDDPSVAPRAIHDQPPAAVVQLERRGHQPPSRSISCPLGYHMRMPESPISTRPLAVELLKASPPFLSSTQRGWPLLPAALDLRTPAMLASVTCRVVTSIMSARSLPPTVTTGLP